MNNNERVISDPEVAGWELDPDTGYWMWKGEEGTGGLWEQNGDDIYYEDGNVGIGTDTVLYPSADRAALTVNGTSSANLVFGHGGVPKHYLLSDASGLTIGTEGNANLTIKADGNVGIGIDTPLRKLHISEDTGAAFLQVTTKDDTSSGGVLMGSSSNPTVGQVFYNHGTDSMRVVTSGEERMTIDADGNVGIGTSDFPYYGTRLYIDGGDDACAVELKSGSDRLAQFYAEAASGEVTLGTFKSNGNLKLMSAGATRMVISGDGNTEFYGTVSAPNITRNGAPVIDAKGLISTLVTLRKATMDETQDIRESLRDAIDELVAGFEQEIAAMPAPEPETGTMEE